MSRTRATLLGVVAILIWAFLALLSAMAGPVPPFQLAAMSFALGAALGAASWPFRPGAMRALRQPWPVWATGIAGLSIYHVAYFYAIQSAPPVEVSLIAYLWPLLVVVFAALLPGERLRPHHVAGVALGLVGAALVITDGFSTGLGSGLRPGHVAALFCAFVWSGYSVLSRRFGAVPVDIVVGYCAVAALVTGALHLAVEQTVWPATPAAWAAVAGLGLLPLGAAFYAWDVACKKGDILVIGALSYAAPVFSVVVLIAAGYARYRWPVAAACLIIVAGALIAARDMLRPARPATPPATAAPASGPAPGG